MTHLTFRRFLAGLVCSATLLACGGSDGGPSDSLVRINFTLVDRWCAPFNPGVLTVTELWGPAGSSTANPLPGRYMARGTYDLTGTGVGDGTIDVGFLGTVTTSQNGESVEQRPHTVSAGQVSGSFEARGGFLQLQSGPGTPLVDFYSGSSVIDCVALY